MATLVMGKWLQQFTCPQCGQIGAGTPYYFPWCDRCRPALVKMQPSHNGVILERWTPPDPAKQENE